MQGKESSEQSPMAKSTAGIDVGQDWLDVHVLPQDKRQRVSNNLAGVRHLKQFLARFDIMSVAVEATGKWHRLVFRNLSASDFPVAMTDPYKVRMFAKAQGLFAKNDRLDARVLAQYVTAMAPPIRPPAPEAIEALAEIVHARTSAVAMQTALKNQLSATQGKFLRRDFEKRIKACGKVIEGLEREIDKRIKADAALARRYEILTSVKGVGPTTAALFIACLRELGQCTAGAIGKLAGLAPHDNESGKHNGTRSIWGGRADVRKATYLAAFSAIRCNPALKAMYERLRAAGKPFKVAVIAVARKLIVLCNTLVAQDRIWTAEPPKAA